MAVQVVVPPLHWRRVLLLTLTGFLLLVAGFEVWIGAQFNGWLNDLGGDFGGYMDATRSWLLGGGFYLDRQMHGPYVTQLHDVLYPPTALWVLVPFSVLPAPLWWIAAIGGLAYLVWAWRPAMWSWPLMAACLAYPDVMLMYLRGSPVIVFAVLVAAGLRWKWPSAFILLKPSIFPFALIGVRDRRWWLTVGLLVVLTLPLVGMLPAWLQAVSDARGWGGWLYSLRDVPLLLLPVFAYAARTQRNPRLRGQISQDPRNSLGLVAPPDKGSVTGSA